MKSKYEINGKRFFEYIKPDEIDELVNKLANQINLDYSGRMPVFLIVLKGSIFFGTDLLKKISLDCTVEVIRAKSYGNSMESSGKIEISCTELDIAQKDIIIIEDIVDTGLTLDALLKKLKTMNPNSIEVVSLLSKPAARKVDVNIKYIGKEIDPIFVIGYGMDFCEKGRQLGSIYILDEG